MGISDAYQFLKECGFFFVLSMNGEYLAGRPFGAVMQVGDYLYLSTHDLKHVHQQIRENEHIQIVAKKSESREWIRITGTAVESNSSQLKEQMMEECQILRQWFSSVGKEHFVLFQVTVGTIEQYQENISSKKNHPSLRGTVLFVLYTVAFTAA